ncbi:glutamate 5-kinase [Clostridium luticellarii]|jgi:glutamate 5-kinase|uniref:Glutamate 5-kinase n=2 Tax=Clostridium luticellarii TaxID=1691940 RepID=A0A2T0BA57_9CLOT|nr:glutamate 5-kinase [Clostridium luticellarii]MCI1945179.1 glutamate 5-kinase [Clostridium luticellarii]MCI1968859.1 glutamate 5-kinase [Clostridium luticellarii]MCI1995645.1 glutamate 5-kinase [Clostridium luticellarii]MCI2040033.1 glutamate 5-kinase [Clostridium luticellarii]PRR80722.1 Glutamate 5-kinase [Clostridium luticellarii]
MDLMKNRVVIKIGTSSLTNEEGKINLRCIDKLTQVLSGLQNLGYEIILVSSGAIAVGTNKMKLTERPKELRIKQAAAAVGQCELMHIYDKFFSEYGKIVAQILLSEEDVDQEGKKHNLINTFDSLLERDIIPIVNENDSVSYREIESGQKIFGDNDTLSAVVAVLCRAKKLILMSDIDGLYESDPRKNPDARLISQVNDIDENIRKLAKGSGSNRGTGGMITKLDAAQIATSHGIDMVITQGQNPENLYNIMDGEQIGTLFIGKKYGCSLA